jgi:hypothetical protein
MAADEVLAWIKVPLPEPAEFLRRLQDLQTL